MDKLKNTEEIAKVTNKVAEKFGNLYTVPEHFLYALCEEDEFQKVLKDNGGDHELLKKDLEDYFEDLPCGSPVQVSDQMLYLANIAYHRARSASKNEADYLMFFDAMRRMDGEGIQMLKKQGINIAALFRDMCIENRKAMQSKTTQKKSEHATTANPAKSDEDWKEYVTPISELVKKDDYIPLIGREKEMAQTLLVLCRKTKNNPLHVGDPGVGKTALAYGLAERINKGEVPEKLKNAKVFGIDMTTMLAGTMYRGDFEDRMKAVLTGLSEEENPIVYLDEIHTIVGAGSTTNSSNDASNMLKPYLADGKIRFIGSTTFEEYKKSFANQKALARRFQKIDIEEPDEASTIMILKGIQDKFEQYHNVTYNKGVIEHIVRLTNKYIPDRCNPDKSIDILDTAGAKLNRDNAEVRKVNQKMVETIIADFRKIPAESVEKDETEKLAKLPDLLKANVFGQDEAADQLSRAIRIARAGLNEDNKPIASLLFVGPTGVGKTEIAKTLAKVMEMPLLRYDMSEFMEKHSVAKFIGSPAGYVGYEDGGRLIEDIKKNPHAVLLLDEVEKAHPDIMNILLQVMDNAELTDSQGNKADFRNVVIIMTSNAGASLVNKPQIGFDKNSFNETAMDEAVKASFSPEFRNRLTGVIRFNGVSDEMAGKIVEKNLKVLETKIAARKISLSFTEALKKFIKDRGVTREYGARQIQRVIDKEIKPLLVDELLFHTNSKTKEIKIDCVDDKIEFSLS